MNWATFSIFSIFLLVAFIESSRAAGRLRIIGGDNAEIESFPYQVSVRYFKKHFCGGSIISDKHILTAAHCILTGFWGKLFRPELRVHSATSRSDKPGTTRKVESIHIHPEWKADEEKGFPNDIAVLTLKDPIVFNKYEQKINLPSHNVQSDEKAYLTGWGVTSNSNSSHSIRLQKLQVNLLTAEKCQPLIAHNIHEAQLCAFKSVGVGACNGDSGGPLVSNGEVVGIVSFKNVDECASGSPDIYTNVFAFKDFIESVIEKK